ncbi:MAG: hypothetical protein R2753_15650 [Chitinophagales bacterium]
MTLLNKIKWLASILLVFFIVLTTNLVDKGNFNSLRHSVTTIFEDRIVANDLIFDISLLMQEKEVAFITSDSLFLQYENEKVNRDIEGLIERYEQTKLTQQEQIFFNDLKDELTHLKSLEEDYIDSKSKENNKLLKSIDEITEHLHDLSKVQLKEGQQQMFISNERMDTIHFFTQVEIVFLIVMGILVQIIILYKPKEN